MFSLRPLFRGVLYNVVNRVSFYVSCRVTFCFVSSVSFRVMLFCGSCRVVLFVLYDRVVSRRVIFVRVMRFVSCQGPS